MTNNKQQTAVEWLIDKHFGGIENCTPDFRNHIEKAKEMQKQMTIKLYNDYENYLEEAFKNQCGGQAVIMSFGAFYDQTFGGGNQ